MTEKFRVIFLDEAYQFLDNIDDKAKEKIIYNIRKAQVVNDKSLFKKLSGGLGNSEHSSTRHITDYLHSGTNQIELILL